MIKLLTLLGTGIPAIIGAILAFITRKVGTATASIAAFVLMTGVFIACINAILSTVLAVLVMPPWIANAVGMFIPGNFTAVLSAIISSKICGAAYDMAKQKILLINNAS